MGSTEKDVKKTEETQEISALKAELEKTRLKLDILLDNIPGGVFSYDADSGKIDYISRGVLSIFQCSEEQFREHYYNSFDVFVNKADRAMVKEMIENQISFFETVELTYRVKDMTDNIMWIYHKGRLVNNDDGTRSFFVVISDITTEKLAQQRLAEINEKLYMETERYKLIEEAVDNTQYDYDVLNDVLTTSGKDEEGNRITVPDFRKKDIYKAVIREEDFPAFKKAMRQALREQKKGVVEYRAKNEQGEVRWYRLNYASFEHRDTVVRIVGSEKDINEEKLRDEELKAKVGRDGMTGLLNKTTMESKVANFISSSEPGSCHALLMVDTDNFKSVNDNLGHPFGDEVIRFVAGSIKDTFRESDFVGRMGGDEFMVLMKDTTPLITMERAAELNRKIKRTFTERDITVGISCSIGIAFYSEDGANYDDLYKAADGALYEAKEAGKNCFRVSKSGS
ncbi:MAG: diguanylate cyclase [Lachnospiraceae bacterium]|nr:diguanylate cyclase [Lachnospiraceae bacterium]